MRVARAKRANQRRRHPGGNRRVLALVWGLLGLVPLSGCHVHLHYHPAINAPDVVVDLPVDAATPDVIVEIEP